jgi:hypothetical protein
MTHGELYGELLDRCLDQCGAPVGLAVYPGTPVDGRQGASGAYQLPQGLLGDRWHRLPVQGSAADFPAAAGRRIEERRPRVALLVSPFLPKYEVPSHLQAHYPGMALHEIAVAEALRAMPNDGRVLALVPAALLTASRSPRKLLLAHWQPTIVIVTQGPQRLIPQVHAKFSFALLALEARTSSGRLLRMFRIPPPGKVDDHQITADFGALLARQRGRSRFGYVISEPLPPDAPLLFERYDPQILQRREELAGLGALRPLEEIADLPARLHTINDRDLLTGGNTGVPVVDGRVITRAGQLDLSSVRQWAKPATDRLPLLEPGDVCVRAIRHPTDGPVPAAVVDASHLPLAASENVVVVRPRPEFRHASSYLAQYLRSPRALELLRAEGLTTDVTSAILRRLVIPLPDPALLEAHADLRQTIAELDAWRLEAEAAAESLFYEESPTAARQRLLGARLVRQRVQAASLLDELGWRVRTRFPFPVARRWARVQAAADDTDGYASAVEAAEVLLCYAALVAITATAASGQPIPYRRRLQRKLLNGSGLSFGDWHQVLVEAATNQAIQALPTPCRSGKRSTCSPTQRSQQPHSVSAVAIATARRTSVGPQAWR